MKQPIVFLMATLLFGCMDSRDKEVQNLYNQVQATLEEVGEVLSLDVPDAMNYEEVVNEFSQIFPSGTKIGEIEGRLSELNDLERVIIKEWDENIGTSIYLIIKTTSDAFSYEISFYFEDGEMLEQILARHAIVGAVGNYE